MPFTQSIWLTRLAIWKPGEKMKNIFQVVDAAVQEVFTLRSKRLTVPAASDVL
jgi:hypothetical protein